MAARRRAEEGRRARHDGYFMVSAQSLGYFVDVAADTRYIGKDHEGAFGNMATHPVHLVESANGAIALALQMGDEAREPSFGPFEGCNPGDL